MFVLGSLAALGGMFCIAATQSKQAGVLFGKALGSNRKHVARWSGTFLLIVSAYLGIAAYGVGIGLVSFFAWACLAGWVVALLITWKRGRR